MAWIDGVEVPDHELPGSWSGPFAYESFLDTLSNLKRKSWEEVAVEVAQPGFAWPPLDKDEFGCLWPAQGAMCPVTSRRYPTWPLEVCKRRAGWGTVHTGIGACRDHLGMKGPANRKAAILMAMLFAEEMQISPWEALLSQVRLLANQVRWLAVRVQNAELEFGVDAIKPDGEAWWAVCMLEARGDRLAKVSKMAIDAGVAERLVRQIELEVDHMAVAALELVDTLGLKGRERDDALDRFMKTMERLELESAA